MTPEQRAMRSRLGGLRRAAMYDGGTVTQRARQVYRDSFAAGHGCSLCQPPVEIPADLSAAERDRRSRKLRALHFARLSYLSARARTKRKAATEVEPVTASDEEHRHALAAT